MSLSLTPQQKKLANELKKKIHQSTEVDPNFCILCPKECAKEIPKEEHWYCPIFEGQICAIDCQFDMDDDDWPRGRWESICKDIGCKNYKEDETLLGLVKRNGK